MDWPPWHTPNYLRVFGEPILMVQGPSLAQLNICTPIVSGGRGMTPLRYTIVPTGGWYGPSQNLYLNAYQTAGPQKILLIENYKRPV